MSFGTTLYTLIYGYLVGEDNLENRYYCNSKKFDNPSAKRWVIYKGEIEATKVPSHWHAWLHKTTNEPPLKYAHKYEWQKDHQPNMTGTKKAYYPDSHPLSNSYDDQEIKSDYESWKP